MSFTMKHEEMVPFFKLKCKCDVLEIPAAGGAGTSTQIIRTDQNWRVTFDWETEGWLNNVMKGDWHLTLYLEKMGAEEFKFSNPNLGKRDVEFVSRPYHYLASDPKHHINVPAGEVPEGVYKLVTTITMTGPDGYRGPIALFGEGQMLQFYDTDAPLP